MDILGHKVSSVIYESNNSVIYRAYQEDDNNSVILKTLKEAYPSPRRIARFKREYEIIKSIEHPNIIDAYELGIDQNRWVMIVEDFGGQSLSELQVHGKLTIQEFFLLVIQAVNSLGCIHEYHIVHRDINPSNLIWNRATGQLKLIDFGISSRLSREVTTFQNPGVLEGTLAYISPEQTGRMNRSIDYRTDFYSLGVTFYELLTGQLPFLSEDPLELIHYHIAHQPIPPQEHRQDIPKMLAAIILKLMTKNAESRYQSTFGIRTDLETCLQQWRNSREVIFPLGQQDVSGQFQLPQKLYGREKEIQTLLTSFERVSQGNSELILVTGYAGIGKSALVQEVYKPITKNRGYFIRGKFDQFQKDIPYAAFVFAFRSLVQQLLTENQTQVEIWQTKLLDALGSNAQVIIDVIPEVELIIGSQPPVPELGAVEAQNRFNLVFQNFIQVFSQPEHPLAIFMDDLQWIDSGSLKLLELSIATENSHHLLLIGAYRNNEVSEGHPLLTVLERIEEKQAAISQIFLAPLNLVHVKYLISEALNCSLKKAEWLSDLVLTKTDGNPFFIGAFLKSLYDEELLTFNHQQGCWHWNLQEIKGRDIADNVVDLMEAKLRRLEEETQQILQYAACIGNQFELQTLANICEKKPYITAAYLSTALEEGLVQPLGEAYKLLDVNVDGLIEEVKVEYRFVHDRVQQAAYTLIPQTEKQSVHLKIGHLLLKKVPLRERERKIFEIVNQLNLGRSLIVQKADLETLAQQNLKAAWKAKASAAYESAFNYLQIGIELLQADCWQHHYDLALSLYTEATEVAYLCSQFSLMEDLAETVLQQAKTVLDRVNVYITKILGHAARGQMLDAVKFGLYAFKTLGITFPENPTDRDIQEELTATQLALSSITTADLYNLPKMTQDDKLAIIHIAQHVLSPAYISSYHFFKLIVVRMVDLCIKFGNAPASAYVYVNYGVILCSFNDIDTGYQFGQLAYSLINKLDGDAKKFMSAILQFQNAFIRPWKDDLRDLLSSSLEGYQAGLESGDLWYAAFNLVAYSMGIFRTGMELGWVKEKISEGSTIMTKLNQAQPLYCNQAFHQAVLNFLGESDDPCCLTGKAFDEEETISLYTQMGTASALNELYFHKFMLCYRFQQYQLAYETARLAEKYINSVIGLQSFAYFYYYDSLVLLAVFDSSLAVFDSSTEDRKKSILKKVSSNQEKLRVWADHAPVNYLHKYYLVEAERYRILGEDYQAREYYDLAISLTEESQNLNDGTLAYELAGKFYLSRNLKHNARYYLQDAYYAYQRWGAVAKVKDLEKQYPNLLIKSSTEDLAIAHITTSPTTTTSKATSGALDLNTVLKASQTISSEIVLDKLLENLMRIAIENAGAQKGFLLLPAPGKAETLVIEAEGAVDSETRSETIKVLQSQAIDTPNPKTQLPPLSTAIVNYVARARQSVVLNDSASEGQFTHDPYIKAVEPKSVLCSPLVNQGQLSGILYLENNLTTGAFTEDRIEVLNILSSQAAISIENARLYETLERRVEERTAELSQTVEVLKQTQAALKLENNLLKSDEAADSFDYQIGGSLDVDSPTYVVRSADRHLYQAMRGGEFCYTFNARQMGKSSLMVRILKQLQEDGYRCIAIDLTRIGGENIDLERWYKGFAVELWRGFGLLRKVKLKPWWADRLDIPAPQRLMQFIEEVLLVEVENEESGEPAKTIVFLDEIDCTLGLDFPMNDFFALIRSCYNQRALDPNYKRLTFALFGAATPSELITDPQKTPFNIGRPIHLEGFKINEAQPLLYGLSDKVNNPQTILKEIIGWTGGQPFLTQKVCNLIRNAKSEIPINGEAQWMEALVRENVLTNWEAKDDPEHLKTVRERILRSDRRTELLSIYQQIVLEEEVPATYSEIEQELLLSGLAIAQEGKLKVNNRIYRSIFDRQWVERHLAVDN